MKIYTKKGDAGKTSIVGKDNLSKSNIRVETYGYLDEVNSFIGFANSNIYDLKVKLELVKIQKDLMLIGSHLADPTYKIVKQENLQKIKKQTTWLEKNIDSYQSNLPNLTNFIIPSGSTDVTAIHVCRTKVRNFERDLIKLNSKEKVYHNIIPYINRLSDYFFTLARYLASQNKDTEIPWKLQ